MLRVNIPSSGADTLYKSHFKTMCRVPGDQMSFSSYPLLVARELIQKVFREHTHEHQATTTPKIRAEIQQASASLSDLALARKYGVSDSTIRRWRFRTDVYDRSHTRHNLLATLTPYQEEVLIAAREFLRLSLDDLLVVAREFLQPIFHVLHSHACKKKTSTHLGSAAKTRARE